MVVYSCCYSKKGIMLQQKLSQLVTDVIWIFADRENQGDAWLEEVFKRHLPVVFIGACGIAVRKISPFVNDKFTDSPVIVIDEDGKYVIPVLSGHLGGANKLAGKIASQIGAEAIITTATDLNNCFAVDIFAQNNKLRICNREGIKAVSARILNKNKLTVWVAPEIKVADQNLPNELELLPSDSIPDYCDIEISEKKVCPCLIHLAPRKFCLGIGCKKGKSFEELHHFVEEEFCKEFPDLVLEDYICAISSIDLKRDEVGLQILAQYYHVPFVTFSASDLEKMTGDFSESTFVKEVTGVSNVCERACCCFGKKNDGVYNLVLRKTAADGMTLALAEIKPEITKWNTEYYE